MTPTPPIDNGVGEEHWLVLTPVGGGAFSVTFHGKVIVKRSQTPEQEAAIVLYNRGITGQMITFHAGSSSPAMRFDIAKTANAAIKRRKDVAARLRA